MIRLLGALSLLLTSASPVSAECGWVLWSGKTHPWDGYKTKKACEGARNVHLLVAGLDAEKYGSQHARNPSSLECLPDTDVTDQPSPCSWKLWKSDVVGMPKSLKTVFRTKNECEQARIDANQTLGQPGKTSFVCSEFDMSTEQERRPPVWLLRREPPSSGFYPC